MLGIIIAAGLGSRLKHMTVDKPKCLLPMNDKNKTMLDQTLGNMFASGCTRCVIVSGHAREAFYHHKLPENVEILFNREYKNNNILHSLMTAKDFFNDDLIISYSDIWVEPYVYERLLNTSGQAVLAADEDWEGYYLGRDEHPVSQAEKIVHYPSNNAQVAAKIGKDISCEGFEYSESEFLGLMRLESDFAKAFRDDFLALDKRLAKDQPFQNASAWEKAYLTDFIQHQINSGKEFNLSLVKKGWAEFDTVQDYTRIREIAESQKLYGLL